MLKVIIFGKFNVLPVYGVNCTLNRPGSGAVLRDENS